MAKSKKAVDQMDTVDTVVSEEVVEAAQVKADAKREAARRFKERRAAEKADRTVKSKELITYMKDNGYWDDCPAELQSFLNNMANPASTAANNSSLFKMLYGDDPKVGDSITLGDAFNKTLKGKSAIDSYIKKWAEKGIVVSFELNSDNMLQSTYTIEALN